MRSHYIALALIAALATGPVHAWRALVSRDDGARPPFGQVIEPLPSGDAVMELTADQLRKAGRLGYDAQIQPLEPPPARPVVDGGGKLKGAPLLRKAEPVEIGPVEILSVGSPGMAAPGSRVTVPVRVRASFGSPTSVYIGIYQETPGRMQIVGSAIGALATGEATYNVGVPVPGSDNVYCYLAAAFYLSGGVWIPSQTWRFSIVPTTPRPQQVVAVLVEHSIYPSALSLVQQYCAAVEARYGARMIIVDCIYRNPRSVRTQLQGLYSSEHLTGAILMGVLPYAIWEFSWDDPGPLPYFYEDLDATFEDKNGNGRYDYRAGGSHPGPEIWVAWMRPAWSDPSKLLPYLQRCVDYYRNGPVQRLGGFVHINIDWWDSVGSMAQCMRNIFTQEPTVYGGKDTLVGGRSFIDGMAAGYQLSNVWAHANWGNYRFDIDNPLRVYWYDIRAIYPGALVTLAYGCHVGDFANSPNGNLPLAYTVGNPAGQALFGATRKVGITREDIMMNGLGGGRTLAEAYMNFKSFAYRDDWVYYWFQGEDPHYFVWDFALNGNPFISF